MLTGLAIIHHYGSHSYIGGPLGIIIGVVVILLMAFRLYSWRNRR